MTVFNSNPSSSDAPTSTNSNVPRVIWRKKKFWAVLIPVCIVLIAFGWNRWRLPVQFDNQAQINLGAPDVWIHSQNLALMPHDVLQEPILKSVLTEDFLYFYQQDVDWLSLQGVMRRLSFEHDLNVSDTLLKDIASAPTDVYMWHDGTHGLRYWAISIERNPLLGFAQQLAKLKLVADKQITEVGRVNIDGDDVPLLKINLSSQRTMLLVAHSKRLVLFSDSAMLTRDEGELDPHADTLLRSLLATDVAQRSPLINGDQAPVMTHPQQQTIWMSNRFYAQGYAAFTPDVQALRFDFDGTNWSGQANVRHVNADPQIWTQIPAYAASCFSTSIDWSQVEVALKAAKAPVDNLLNTKALESLAPTGAVCWFAERGDDVAQPLFVALRTAQSTVKPEDLNALFDWGVAQNRDYQQPLLELKAQKRNLSAQLNSLTDELKSLKKDHRHESHKDKSDAEIAQANMVYSDTVKEKKDEMDQLDLKLDELSDQLKAAKKELEPEIQKAQALTTQQQGSFTTIKRTESIVSAANPMLAFSPQVIYFSPNSSLVQRAMRVAEKRYPNLQESTGSIDAHRKTLVYINPSKLSQLFTQTGQHALSPKTDQRLRTAFDYHMPERMSALAKFKPFTVSVDHASVLDGGSHWQPLMKQSGQ